MAEAIEARIKGPNGTRQGQRTDLETSGNISGSERGETKDIVAQKAGLGSGKTLEAAQKVVERGIPELVEAMDRGNVQPPPRRTFEQPPVDDRRRPGA